MNNYEGVTMNTCEKIEQIENRLQTVERASRRWKAVATLAVVVAIGIGTLGAAMNRAARVVDVEGINFVDKDGVDRGFIGITSENHPSLIFRDEAGKDRIVLQMLESQPTLALFGSTDEGSAIVKVDEHGGVSELKAKDGMRVVSGFSDKDSGISVVDNFGKHRGFFGIGGKESQGTQLMINNEQGELRLGFQATNDHAMLFLLDGKSGNPEVLVESKQGLGGKVQLFNSEGKAYFVEVPGN